ncbi:unnamed protein product [Sphagnum compactum]
MHSNLFVPSNRERADSVASPWNRRVFVPDSHGHVLRQILRTEYRKILYTTEDRGNGVEPPSSLVRRLGERIDDPESIYYWAARNGFRCSVPHLLMDRLRNGADYVVLINTGNEYDGSDSGASTEEAVSWGKIKTTAKHVKVHGEASLLFPLLVAQTLPGRSIPYSLPSRSAVCRQTERHQCDAACEGSADLSLST